MNSDLFFRAVIGLLLTKWMAQLGLELLNQSYVRGRAHSVPEAFKEIIDPPTYAKSVAYTLAKSRFEMAELTCDLLILIGVLWSGLLPWFYGQCAVFLGHSAWAMAAFVVLAGSALAATSLPFDWFGQFHLEERFGFNTTTPKLWWLDRIKAFVLTLMLGYPILVLILCLVHWTGPIWWLWAWGALLAIQLIMVVIAPIWILPLFNKFTPLPEGPLRQRLLELGRRTGFQAHAIQIMDGSKRSRHSNAFFTGFGRFRKIILFDTLIGQLTETELEAVLAHEIGHYKKKHIPKMLFYSAGGLLLGLFILSALAGQNWLYQAFGFAGSQPAMPVVPVEWMAVALLLFGLLSGAVTFWLAPLVNRCSRRYEYQADAYAAAIMGEPCSLVSALRKLNEKNLSNLTPHPLYSGFHYSHPTLLEREQALLAKASQCAA